MYVCIELVEVLWGGGEFKKWRPGDSDRVLEYQSLRYLPSPEHILFSARLHLITDTEEGFRTAVWFS